MSIIKAEVPNELNNKLIAVAKSLELSEGFIINEAIERYVTEALEDIEDAKIALERKKEGGKLYTSSEVRDFIMNNLRV